MTDIYQKAYTSIYPSRLGDILLAADEIGLTGLWFFGQSYFADTLPAEQVAQETPILAQAREWLDEYFSGKEPGFVPSFHVSGTRTLHRSCIRSDRRFGRRYGGFCCRFPMVRR